MGLIDKELSEPYSIFTYRYFINNWRSLCILAREPPPPCFELPTRPHVSRLQLLRAQAYAGEQCVGAVVSKLDKHGEMSRGYIAMLVVDKPFRKFKIGTELVQRSLKTMATEGADEARGPGPAAASGHACLVQRATSCAR